MGRSAYVLVRARAACRASPDGAALPPRESPSEREGWGGEGGREGGGRDLVAHFSQVAESRVAALRLFATRRRQAGWQIGSKGEGGRK